MNTLPLGEPLAGNIFVGFPKIARLRRNIVITEKIDGTNAQIVITDAGDIFAGSRNRMLTLKDDNFGFARWVEGNKPELIKLGPGRHFGEWWGSGIQRTYGLKGGEKRFSLFNTHRWGVSNDQETPPACCSVAPVLHRGPFEIDVCDNAVEWLRANGSAAAPGFMDPEGIVVFHTAAGTMFKQTLVDDEKPKSA